ncbi:glutamine amidotransferase-related protein [Shewanella woodyi]|uniref:glutamine amidotransferase-related protein n=1 Tax=Shewanella woodyi TaxID=60961 RepID=UPI0037494DCA
MQIHFIIHEEFEGPAAFDLWVNKRGYSASYTRVYKGDTFPNQIDNLDLLVILGGPQNPNTSISTCHYFDANAEKEFIKRAIDNNLAVIGVCLGAQLIGEALGADYENSPQQEIGYFKISLTQAGLEDQHLNELPTTLIVGHWHQDMPGLTSSSQVLASSQGCPRQIIKYQARVYGFQCHLEFTSDSIEALILASGLSIEDTENQPYVQSPQQLKEYDYTEMNHYLFLFLNSLILEQKRVKRGINTATRQ